MLTARLPSAKTLWVMEVQMENAIIKGLIWKVPLIGIAILALHYEVASYTNTKGSIGELILNPNQENAFLISSTITLLLGITLIFVKNKLFKIVLVGLVCFILLLFYPSFDMQGVDHAF
jgi:hypothetical protein